MQALKKLNEIADFIRITVQAGYLLSVGALPETYPINIILCFGSMLLLHIFI